MKKCLLLLEEHAKTWNGTCGDTKCKNPNNFFKNKIQNENFLLNLSDKPI